MEDRSGPQQCELNIFFFLWAFPSQNELGSPGLPRPSSCSVGVITGAAHETKTSLTGTDELGHCHCVPHGLPQG